ncbi:MAG: SDR family NAD(P)-dependent oxidoreductase [Myxococcota bacterium]
MNRIALVTGASSGFGAAIARRLVAAGDTVIGTGRRAERLDALAAELGSAFRPLVFDLTDRAATDRAVARFDAEPVDVLVNNAGLALGIGKAWEASVDQWETMIATNCAALARVTRAVVPAMVRRGSGHVVDIGSIAADTAYPGGNVYGATKAFVRQFTANLRADLHGTGVRATVIEIAAAETEFSVVRFSGDAARAKAVYQGFTPLSADDVAAAVTWALDQPRHVNVARIDLWPTAQAPGGPVYHRTAT